MHQERRTTVRDAFVRFSDVHDGQLRLYEHQLDLVEADGDPLVLDAPTGSGKTLAALKRVIKRKTPAIFVYPTNTLVKNQVESMIDLLTKMNKTVNLIERDSSGSFTFSDDKDAIDLIHLTGESLETLAGGGSKGSAIDTILTHSKESNRMRILLTNPDMIYLAFAGFYWRHGRIMEQIDSFRVIVLDEFHLYSGPTLARLVYLLNDLRGNPMFPSFETIFLSATHGDTLELLQSSYPNLCIVRTIPLDAPENETKMIRHQTECTLRIRNRIMYGNEDVDEAAQAILELYNEDSSNNDNKIKVLGVFSSVIFAVKVASRVRTILENEGRLSPSIVKEIHGLVPNSERVNIEHMENGILIGTSAVEVGIDFNVPYLVMESHDIASFLQRFGRGGRHKPCKSVLYIPRTLADNLAAKSSWSFADFSSTVHEALAELPSYAEFVCSHEARDVLLAMALSASRNPFSRSKGKYQFDYDTAVEYFQILIESNSQLQMGTTKLTDNIGSMDKDDILCDMERWVITTLAENGFIRGTMNSVLSKIPVSGTNGNSVYAEIDIFDIFKVTGYLETASSHWKSIPPRLKRRYQKDSPLFVIENFERGYHPTVKVANDACHRYMVGVYTKPEITLTCGNLIMDEVLSKLLEKRNLAFYWYGLNPGTDFRIPRFPSESRTGGLVIGDWAFVAKYLVAKKKKENERL
ncbi:MAG: type I-D CRISPR-associated helicase Cas3' [Candidatus Lokiarchaeota archaeon]|nr:type I-D CRISPR-associated helicase Cas3' [Candidatus Lokiarchaeota archaeon]